VAVVVVVIVVIAVPVAVPIVGEALVAAGIAVEVISSGDVGIVPSAHASERISAQMSERIAHMGGAVHGHAATDPTAAHSAAATNGSEMAAGAATHVASATAASAPTAATAATFHQLKQAGRGGIGWSEGWRGVCRQGDRCKQG
jgi:hypothetical protein